MKSTTTRPIHEHTAIRQLKNVPEHWNIRRLKSIATIVAGQSPPSEAVTDYDGHFPFLQGNAEFGSTTPAPRLSCQAPNKRAQGGDILLSVRAPVGAINIADQDYGIGRGLCAIRPTTHINRDFLHYTLQVTKISLSNVATGSTYDAVTVGQVGDVPTPLPPPSEQAAIVRYLDHIDELINRYISAKERLIALLEEQRQAVIHQAVIRGVDPHVPMRPTDVDWLGDVPQHWKKRRLKEVAAIQAGITIGPDNGHPGLSERPYLRVANVQADHLDLSQVTKIRVSPAEIKRSTLQVGDVLMTEGGDIDKLGRGCIWQGEIPGCLHQNHVFAVRPNPALLNPGFLVAVMGSVHGRTYFYLTAKQTTNLAATNRTTLGNFPIHLPSASEQLRILNHVEDRCDAVDKAINQARRQIGLIDEYRTRLIADAVTGQIDVRNEVPQLPD